MGKRLERKLLKPQAKKAVLNMVDAGNSKTDLLKESFDFNLLLGET